MTSSNRSALVVRRWSLTSAERGNNLCAAEKELSALNTRMLAGVSAKYGKDSNEYEKAGGTRTSEIKRSPRTKKAATQ